MNIADQARERIKRIHKCYLKDISVISIQRARYYTEKWRETENSTLSPAVRVALAVKHVYENMDICIHRDDRIAGTWTENYLGIPIDIERGLFNKVMEIELDRPSMIRYLVKTNLSFFIYMFRKYGILNLYRNLKHIQAVGAAMPSIGTKPVDKRNINPYSIRPKDRKILQKELLPYWEGKTIVDVFRKELESSNIYKGDMLSFAIALPSTTSRNDTIISPGAGIGNWQGHVILDHEKYLRHGLIGMRSAVQGLIKQNGNLSPDERAFLDSIDIVLEGVMIYARRLTEKLKQELERENNPEQKQILSEMLEICEHVPLNPARTFREATQSYWTVKTAVALAIPFNVHTPGRLDQILFPYYRDDIAEGRITRDEACWLLQELFLKVMSHNMRPYSNFTAYFASRYEGSEPVTLGGQTVNGEDLCNELTHVILDAAEQSKVVLNFAVRFNRNTPDELYMRLADMYYNGYSSVSMLNDDVCLKAMEKRGFPQEDAREYAMGSCVDLCVPGKMGSMSYSALLLCRTLDITLRNGDARTLVGTVANVGLKTGEPEGFSSFGEFVDAYVRQAAFQIEKIAEASCIRDRLYAKYLPAPHISAFIQGCLEKKKDVTRGGGIYDLEGILYMSSIANVVDSLYVIKKLIFERREFTFKELLSAIDNNFTGYEHIHRMIQGVEGKWGNGNPESDDFARDLTTRLFTETFKYRTYKGGFIAPFVNSMTSHTYDGRICIATADGRKGGKPFASSCNPYNVDKHGPTGVLRSVATMDFTNVLGVAVNLRMHPSAIGKDTESRKKWISLVKTYFGMGGEQLQPTVVSTEVLRAAQKNPENYMDVVVKVGGYSACFVDLGYEIQEEIISRSEHKMV
ncbi:MAG: pyruvate formate lyase family protein [Dehalococcoidia bacterium]|jgi:formate C-acetyltransferase